MDPTFFLVACSCVAVGAAILGAHRGVHRLSPAWREALRANGLEEVAARRSRMEARRPVGGSSMRVELHPDGTGGTIVLVRVDSPLRIRPEPRLRVRAPGNDVRVGDDTFDEAIVVDAETLAALALLGPDVRRHLLTLAGRTSVSAGGLHLDELGLRVRVRDARALPTILGVALAAAEAVRTPAPDALEGLVAARAAADPLPSVRAAALKALVEERPRHPATRSALQAALRDADPAIRLTAALALRSEGREVLRALACDPSGPDAVTSRALEAMGGEVEVAEIEPVLARARTHAKPRTLAACLQALAARNALGPLRESVRAADADEVKAAARALAFATVPEAETLLVPVLSHSEAGIVAAQSLARIGTAAAVPALREAEKDFGWQDAVFARALREAVASIQARLLGAARGQLSVAADGGEVSLADDARGRVSVRDDSGDRWS